ncbi:MAG: hypothetical protein HYV07_29205 [Deltaproteobacteria bacterium]|nr:hypothetical protein [Deltaproteobacteria bacterium]
MFPRIDALDANRPRFPRSRGGHVESYFLRANHPTEPKAFWLKATVMKPLEGPQIAEAWAIAFDGTRRFATRETVPLESAHFLGSPPRIDIADAHLHVDGEGSAKGTVKGSHGTCRFEISLRADTDAPGKPMCLLPATSMIDGPFPKSKLLTPFPSLRVSGKLETSEFAAPGPDPGSPLSFAFEDWQGMQGHNWGKEHAHEYVWGQCPFFDATGKLCCVVEAFTARIKLGPIVSPRISALVVRTREQELRFDRLYDLWRQGAEVGELSWRLNMSNEAGRARLSMSTSLEQIVCLGYDNPNGVRSYCVNSKLAAVSLELETSAGRQTFTSAHGGALELLSGKLDPRITRVV